MATQAVVAAAHVLELVASDGPIGTSEISRRTGIPKATVQRALLTWSELGWIRRTSSNEVKWTLTGKLTHLALGHDDRADLKEVAHPVMMQLSRETSGETVHLVVRDDDHVQLLDKISGTLPVRTNYQIGQTSPINAVATGQAILAQHTDEFVRGLLGGYPLQAKTETTVTDLDALITRLHEIRKVGFASVERTNDPETSAIAAAVLKPDGEPIGAISISLPTVRVTDELVERYSHLVMKAAADITVKLG